MNLITKKDAENLQKYFGDFGGMIIPDAFTLELNSLVEDARAVLPGEEFNQLYRNITGKLPQPEVRTKTAANGMDVSIIRSQAKYYIAAGHITLALCRGVKKASIGCEDNNDVLRFTAHVCSELGLELHVYLSMAQSSDEALKADLTDQGCFVDDTSCVKLYNRPYMYAYQKFIGDRANSAFIAESTEVGCYPFPALSGLFAGQFGQKLRALIPSPSAVAVTIKSGSAAVAAFRAYKDAACRLITVEQPVCQQFYVDSYGSATLSVRPAASSEYNHNIAPELCNMWRMAEVVRLGAENYHMSENATERALYLIENRLPAIESLLLVEGENE